MSTKIFINLPVKDLQQTIAFYTKLGFTFNEQFTNENGTCMIVSDSIFVMLLVEPFFKTFIPHKEISNAQKSTEVLLCISAENRESVDRMVSLAIAAGGSSPMPKQDYGWMYSHAFEDLDGHIWEVAYIDETAIPQNP